MAYEIYNFVHHHITGMACAAAVESKLNAISILNSETEFQQALGLVSAGAGIAIAYQNLV